MLVLPNPILPGLTNSRSTHHARSADRLQSRAVDFAVATALDTWSVKRNRDVLGCRVRGTGGYTELDEEPSRALSSSHLLCELGCRHWTLFSWLEKIHMIELELSLSEPGFASGNPITLGTGRTKNWSTFGNADLTGDGLPDIATCRTDINQLQVYPNSSGGTMTGRTRCWATATTSPTSG